MKKSRKGFTLVELLVVIAILAVLATVSIIGYTSFIDRAHESSAFADANALVTTLLPELGFENDTDLIIFSVKGGKLYVYGYTGNDRKVVPYKVHPYGALNAPSVVSALTFTAYAAEETALEGKVSTVLAEMAAANEITERSLDADDWRQPERVTALMIECGFDPETTAIRANYKINEGFFRDVPAEEPPESGFSWDDENDKLLYDGDPYTGTVDPDDPNLPPQALPGIEYIDGIPYVTCTYDEVKDEYVFTIPEGAEYYSTLKLDFTDFATGLNDSLAVPNSFGGYGVRIIDNTEKFSITSATFGNSPIDLYDEGKLSADNIPQITCSTAFVEYMRTLGYSGSTSGINSNYINEYIARYNGEQGTEPLPKTFTQFLKEKYNIDTLDDLTFLQLNSESAAQGMFGGLYYDSTIGQGLTTGNTTGINHVEPEVIKALLKNLYDDTTIYSFLTSNDYDPNNPKSTEIGKLLYATQYGDGNLYNYAGENWKINSANNGWDCHSLLELVNGERVPENLNFISRTADGVKTTTGAIYGWWHICAGNAYQGRSFYLFDAFIVDMTNPTPAN